MRLTHILRSFRTSLETLLGGRLAEAEWQFRHLYKSNWAQRSISSQSFAHPHRRLLVERISAYAPFSKVLEVGCASGPNLFLLAREFPKTHFVGIDLNSEAIKQGTAFLEREHIENVSLVVGKADKLKAFPDKSFDLVLTDAVLMYIAPRKIKQIAAEFQRISKKAIVVLEHHSREENELGTYQEGWLIRNYIRLFEAFGNKISETKITAEVWKGNWSKYGYIVEVAK